MFTAPPRFNTFTCELFTTYSGSHMCIVRTLLRPSQEAAVGVCSQVLNKGQQRSCSGNESRFLGQWQGEALPPLVFVHE